MATILLVAPHADLGVESWLDYSDQAGPARRAHVVPFVVPLHLATIAGLTPDHHQVTLWDETVQGPVDPMLEQDFDIVGTTGYFNQMTRAMAVLDLARARGGYAVAGGAGISADPALAEGHADSVFIGEAEATWPRFLDDWAQGRPHPVYVGDAKADLAAAPPPKWDSIAHLLAGNYKSGSVQTNRGCPHNCEFCSIWSQFGRINRAKPTPRVMAEIATLERLGMRRIILSTDNFVANPGQAKDILRALVPLNRSFARPLAFATELTIVAARDPEMLALMAQANFTTLFVGLESPSLEALAESRKRHNMKGSLVDQVRLAQSHGMAVLGSLIVGFDSDGPDIFDAHFQFLQDSCVTVPRLNILRADVGTDLYDRMVAEGRVVDVNQSFPDDPLKGTHIRTNMMFKTMSRAETYAGFLDLARRVWAWDNFHARMAGFIDNLTNIAGRPDDPAGVALAQAMVPVIAGIPMVDMPAVHDLLARVRAVAPGMLGSVTSQIMMQCFHAARLPALTTSLEKQIRQERHAERTGALTMVTAATAKPRMRHA